VPVAHSKIFSGGDRFTRRFGKGRGNDGCVCL